MSLRTDGKICLPSLSFQDKMCVKEGVLQMTFPVYIHLFSLKLHPHAVFEALAYFIGFRVYLYTRNKEKIPVEKAISVLVGAIVGAAAGSKLLYWFEDPLLTAAHVHDLFNGE